MHELQVNDSNFLVLSITTRPKKKKKKCFCQMKDSREIRFANALYLNDSIISEKG